MTFTYPAVFKKVKGGYEGSFPDLKGCVGRGKTLEEAILSAHEAARDWITLELGEEIPDMPSISEPGDLHPGKDETVRNICVTIRLFEGWDE
jgi:predicted RNase H-like HicB family nuclease